MEPLDLTSIERVVDLEREGARLVLGSYLCRRAVSAEEESRNYH